MFALFRLVQYPNIPAFFYLNTVEELVKNITTNNVLILVQSLRLFDNSALFTVYSFLDYLASADKRKGVCPPDSKGNAFNEGLIYLALKLNF